MKIAISIFLFFIFLNATIFEDAEDKKISRWTPYEEVFKVKISNVYDKDKNSRVILLKSKNNRDGYMLALERNSSVWCKTKGKSLKWSMKTNSDFVIFISLQTLKGHRTLVYIPSNGNGSGYYGLGKSSIDGKWHRYSRDLDLDLKRYEFDNEIFAVDTMFIRGNLMIDDVEIKNIIQKDFKYKKSKKCITPISKSSSSLILKDDEPPIIKLNGYKNLKLPIGAKYVEQGAKAFDNIDGEIPVEISESVDTSKAGRYTIFYMAKDRAGNESIETRVIIVGSIKSNDKKRDTIFNNDILNLPEDEYLEEFGLYDD